MKYTFLVIIRLYWLLIPESKRRECVFRHSCSKYVFGVTSKEGFFEGMKAFYFRYKNCRNGFEVFKNPMNGQIQMILPDKSVIEENDISERLIIKHK